MLTLKERLAAKRAVPQEMRKALTPEQMAAPSCRWFHRWVRVDGPTDMTFYASYQCRKCHDRKAVCMLAPGSGYSAPPSFWIEGKEWGYLPPIPTARSGVPRSVVPPPPKLPPRPEDMIRTVRDA